MQIRENCALSSLMQKTRQANPAPKKKLFARDGDAREKQRRLRQRELPTESEEGSDFNQLLQAKCGGRRAQEGNAALRGAPRRATLEARRAESAERKENAG